MILETATVSTIGANHDIITNKQGINLMVYTTIGFIFLTCVMRVFNTF